MKVLISGLYAGPNPSPGVSISECVRSAYPDVRIVGVDYTDRNTGLHWKTFDEIEIQRPWNQIDPDQYGDYLTTLLNKDAYWLSGLDLEIWWMAERGLASAKGALIPPIDALRATARSNLPELGQPLGYVPDSISLRESDWDLHAFLRASGWKAWLKGPHYDAVPIRRWSDVEEARRQLIQRWGDVEFFLQKHVQGEEECLAFCAYKGELLDAVHMKKHSQSREGKTWAGRVSEPESALRAWLSQRVSELEWTGGGELEFVRDASGRLALLEWNPHFSAWIHGAVFAGRNLPGLLLQAASNAPMTHPERQGEYFARVVVETPCRDEFPPPPPRPSGPHPSEAYGKAPSGVVELAGQLQAGGGPVVSRGRNEPPATPEIDTCLLASLRTQVADLQSGQTPKRVLLADYAEEGFAASAAAARLASSGRCEVKLAYSLKTNPDPRLLSMALQHGFSAEVISAAEYGAASAAGFSPERIVMNGPAKTWPKELGMSAYSAGLSFADSIEELETALSADAPQSSGSASLIGLRLRPPRARSRFGIDVGAFDVFDRCARLLSESPRRFEIAVHFHIAAHAVGANDWFDLLDSVLRWARTLQDVSGHAVATLDLGGGWFPEDWRDVLLPALPSIITRCEEALPQLRHVYLEPGRALAQDSSALLTRVLQRRHGEQLDEIVVDASIAEVPNAWHYPHRLLKLTNGEWIPVGKGNTRILGRSCMEEDILATSAALDASEGDLLAILDCGAYDSSMAYSFGQGGRLGPV